MKRLRLWALISVIIFMQLIFISSAQLERPNYGSAESADTQLSAAQPVSAYGLFNSSPIKNEIGTGIKGNISLIYPGFPFEPTVLLYNFNTFIFIPNNNYIQVYDDNLNLLRQKSTGAALTQLSAGDFNGDGINEINGVFESNNTEISFKVFTFNSTNYNLDMIYEKNYTITSNSLNRVVSPRSYGANTYFMYVAPNNLTTFPEHFIKINQTAHQNIFIKNISGANTYVAPLAFKDMNLDGKLEFLTYSTKEIMLFDEDGTILFNHTLTGGYDYQDVKMIKQYNTGLWRIAYSFGASSDHEEVGVYNLDGSTAWSTNSNLGINYAFSRLAVSDDFNSDGYQDLFYCLFTLTANTNQLAPRYEVLNGQTGAVINATSAGSFSSVNRSLNSSASCNIADMNGDGYQDVIFTSQNIIDVFSTINSTRIFSQTVNMTRSCIPVDINRDSFQELLCSGDTYTSIMSSSSSTTNAAPNINSIVLNPSSRVAPNSTLTVTISATDAEGNPIQYAVDCTNSGVWGVLAGNTGTCSYGSLGTYTLKVGVKDVYHLTYNNLSTTITVVANHEEATTSGGTVSLKKDLVTTDGQSGILPDIYEGILIFFSIVWKPAIIVIFLIIAAMIITALIALIIKVAGG